MQTEFANLIFCDYSLQC